MKTRQDMRFLVKTVRGEELGDRLADHFVGGVTEHALRRLVPAHDNAIKVFADDGVVG